MNDTVQTHSICLVLLLTQTTVRHLDDLAQAASTEERPLGLGDIVTRFVEQGLADPTRVAQVVTR